MRMTFIPTAGLVGRGIVASLLALMLAITTPALAQFGGGGGGGGFGGGGGGGGLGGGGGGGLGGGGGGLGGGGGGGGLGGGGGGAGGGGGGIGSGVVVDAAGVLHRTSVADPGGRLAQQRIAESLNRLEGDLAKSSKLRKVSLTRLEAALDARLNDGQQPTDEMESLAGLTRIDYVFCYPATDDAPGEVVVAGPAEPWAIAPSGRKLGIETGAPIIELQDLVVALRAFTPEADSAKPLIYCSIDPTEEGLQRMQRFLARVGAPNPNTIAAQLQERLGEQEITVGGVPSNTHFAQVLVEADYRMKLIGIGLEEAAAPIQSYVSRVNPATVSRNALQRWYFVPDYERIKATDDGLAMEMVGEGVRLVGEDEVVSRDGGRRRLGRNNRASTKFVNEFTDNFGKLAEASPVYAQLRNCIDLAVVAAFAQDRDLYGKAGWTLGALGDEERYSVRKHNAPQKVASAVNAIWKNSTLMTPIGGGVHIRATESLEEANVAADEDGKLAAQRDAVAGAQASDAWWWD